MTIQVALTKFLSNVKTPMDVVILVSFKLLTSILCKELIMSSESSKSLESSIKTKADDTKVFFPSEQDDAVKVNSDK